jgi:hypothetical protein
VQSHLTVNDESGRSRVVGVFSAKLVIFRHREPSGSPENRLLSGRVRLAVSQPPALVFAGIQTDDTGI